MLIRKEPDTINLPLTFLLFKCIQMNITIPRPNFHKNFMNQIMTPLDLEVIQMKIELYFLGFLNSCVHFYFLVLL